MGDTSRLARRTAALAALVLAACVPSGAAGGPPPPVSPLVNGDFEAGSPVTVDTSEFPLQFLLEEVGSVLPGTTEDRSQVAAAGWSARVYSGQRTPESTVRWGLGIGTPIETLVGPVPSAALEVTYDERDSGPEVLTLTQPLGQRPHLGLVRGATAVQFEARTPFGHPLSVRAGVFTVEERWVLTLGPPVLVTSADYASYSLPFPQPTGTVTQFFLFVEGEAGKTQDTVLYLDDLALVGAVVEPAYDLSGGIVGPWLSEVCQLTGVCP